ncbi:hypothetical protein IPM19_01170 [bacterium]|nr:MAG: hypothetical protein IPM19_01170 [bacterium]
MDHTVFKQKWRRTSDSGEEFVYSIHLNSDKARLFAERELNKPSLPGLSPAGPLTPWTVNNEIFGFLHSVNGIWTEEQAFV